MKKIITYIVLCSILLLTACSNANESMYEVKQETQTEETASVQKGVGTIEALVDDNANSDSSLGTKHIVIIDGVPYAELDGKEHVGENDTYKSSDTIEKSKTQEDSKQNIDNAINDIINDNKQDTENTEEVLEENTEENKNEEENISDVLKRFIDVSKSHGMDVDYTSDINKLRDLSHKYGIYVDKKDNGKEIGIAYDVDNVVVFDIVTYDNVTDVELAFALNNKYTYSIKGMELVEADSEHSIIEINTNKTDDKNNSIMEFRVIENSDKNEYYIIGATYLKNNEDANKILESIIEEIR